MHDNNISSITQTSLTGDLIFQMPPRVINERHFCLCLCCKDTFKASQQMQSYFLVSTTHIFISLQTNIAKPKILKCSIKPSDTIRSRCGSLWFFRFGALEVALRL